MNDEYLSLGEILCYLTSNHDIYLEGVYQIREFLNICDEIGLVWRDGHNANGWHPPFHAVYIGLDHSRLFCYEHADYEDDDEEYAVSFLKERSSNKKNMFSYR